MSRFSMVEAKLPPGFRFHPKDDELVCDYLLKKWNGCESSLLIEVDLNKCEPWDIPEWYFYSQRDKKYATGSRTNRATVSGYWKATGKDRPVVRRGSLVGMRKTLVFYQGRAPKGRKTDWVMHEFRVEGPFGPPKSITDKEDWVLCRVFCKSKEEEIHTRSDNTANESNNNCYDETASSSLPPLTDKDSYISFDQTTNDNNNNYNQQVPCFSIYSNNTPNPNNNLIFPQFSHHQNPNFETPGGLGSGSGSGSRSGNINPLVCDNKVIEAMLSQLTKMDNTTNIMKNSPPTTTSIGGDPVSSDQSYLSEVGIPPNIWHNHHY